MLVDGCLVDNVPLVPMHQLKSGPNLVVHFGEPEIETFDVDYAALPGRLELAAAMLVPFRKKLLPKAPSAVNVLWRSLVAHQRYDTIPADAARSRDAATAAGRHPGNRVRAPRRDFPIGLSLGARAHHSARGGGQFRYCRDFLPAGTRKNRAAGLCPAPNHQWAGAWVRH